MTTITNETIIKAAKAAGLDVHLEDIKSFMGAHTVMLEYKGGTASIFDPLNKDTDNAMIMDGADICLAWHIDAVSASFYIDEHGMHSEPQSTKSSKAQARRDAVILCAAAKYDAMNGEVK